MIPLRIKIVNFLSYRDEVNLDLRGVHVACLSGDNGHGKSAILDSVTWALWGWARGRRYGQGGTSPDELIHQGQSDMEVSLDFAKGEATYRVIRKYSKGAKARSSGTILDLQADTGDGFSSLSVGGVLETERKIYQVVSMDYETFVNSAFLMQGDADRFTTSQPAHRKEILAEILGLSMYERLSEISRARKRDQETILMQSGIQQIALQEEIDTKPTTRLSLDQAHLSLETTLESFEAATHELQICRDQVRVLKNGQQEVTEIMTSTNRTESEISNLQAQIDALKTRIMDSLSILNQSEDIENGLARFHRAQEQLLTLENSYSEHVELSKLILRIESSIAQQRVALESEQSTLEERIAEIKPKLERVPQIDQDLERINNELLGIAQEANEIKLSKQELDGINLEFDLLSKENTRLYDEMQDLRTRLDLLTTEGGTCPLCGTTLAKDVSTHLQNEMESQGVNNKQAFLKNQSLLTDLDSRRKTMAGQIKSQEANLTDRQNSLQAQKGSLTRELGESNVSAASLQDFNDRLTLVETRIVSGNFAEPETTELHAATHRLTQLNYDPAQHESIRHESRSSEQYSTLMGDLIRAKTDLPDQEATLEKLNTLLTVRQQDAEHGANRLQALQKELKNLPELEEKEADLSQLFNDLDSKRSDLQAEVRLYQFRIQELENKEADQAVLKEARASGEQTLTIYSVLEEAFGRRGLQALLIEAAIPSLEVEANVILARLTDNRMHLAFETQKQNKRGETSETLEIRISDELGTRSYELFSGGEAFRINFAIRVALSKILASRSGAPLRALFLDEGFGTQDVDGRNRLTEAISSIQEDFDLILVITHVDQIKEAFPVRIEVTKTEFGSSIQTIWAG